MDPRLTALLAFVAVLFLAAALLERRARPSAVARRLADHAVAAPSADVKRLEKIDVLKESAYAVNGPLARLRQAGPARRAAHDLMLADVKMKPWPYLGLRVLLGGVGFLAVSFVTGSPLFALAGAAAGLLIPRFVLKQKANKRRDEFEAQLAEALDLMVGALRAGHGFLQAIEATARELSGPMRQELLRFIDQVNVGGGVVDALQGMTERVDSADLKLLAAAVAVQRQSGGNLAEVLENLAKTVRERRRIRGEVKSLTAGPRLSGYILGAMPFGIGVYFALMSADYRRDMLGTDIGKMMLVGAAVWTVLGFLLSQKVAKVEY